jgi:hypothetical protein
MLYSPEHRRTPQTQYNHPAPVPFHLNLPIPPASTLPTQQHDPFQVVNHNGHALTLSQNTAMALNSLPPLIPLRSRGRGVSMVMFCCFYICKDANNCICIYIG